MKPEEDFYSMFHILDAKNKGFLECDAIANVYESLFFQPVDSEMIDAVMHTVCGGMQCSVENFQTVLVKLEEGRMLQENVYWDFMSMDRVGTAVVWPSDALLLARSVKGKDFSLDAWNQWNSSRHKPTAPVCWDEFKKFLYFLPGKQFAPIRNEAEFLRAYESLSSQEAEVAMGDYKFYKDALENDEAYSTLLLQEKQQYQEEIQYESNRLANRWEVGGVEAVIHDDGTVMETITDSPLTKADVRVSEFIAALIEKYDFLRGKLFWEMVRAKTESGSSQRKVSPSDMHERLRELCAKEKEMRRSGTLQREASSLFGADLVFNWDLDVLMGETSGANQAIKWEETKKRFEDYRRQGKSVREICSMLEQENLQKMRGSSTTGEKLLIDLWRRQEREKEHLLQNLSSIALSPSSAVERVALFASLFRQCERAQECLGSPQDFAIAVGFAPSASGVAVAERRQAFEPNRFSEDSARQERLATDRIRLLKQEHRVAWQPEVGERLEEVSQAKQLGPVASWIEATKLMEIHGALEREMLVHFLLDKNENRNALLSKSLSDLEQLREKLKVEYQDWKDKSSRKSIPPDQKRMHLSLLREAAILYQEFMRRAKEGKRDIDLAACVLAQLQTIQDVHFQDTVAKLKAMNVKTPAETQSPPIENFLVTVLSSTLVKIKELQNIDIRTLSSFIKDFIHEKILA